MSDLCSIESSVSPLICAFLCGWFIVCVIAVLQFSVVHRLQQLAKKEEHEQPHVNYDLIMSAILIASTHF